MESKNDDSIHQILRAYVAAIYNKDTTAYLNLYHDDVVIFDAWGPPWTYEGLPTWRKVTEEWFVSLGEDRVVVDVVNIQINTASTLAVLFATVKFTAKSAEGLTLRWLQNRLTCVIEPKNHVWKIKHQHTSTPIDGDLKAILKP
jgi:ketosteroid isomerase-like protein